MTAWKQRIWISAGAVALAASVGLWWQRPASHTLIVADFAEIAARYMENTASLSYSPTQTFSVGWVTLASVTNGARAAWGGYTNVTFAVPSTGGPTGTTNGFAYATREYWSIRNGAIASRRGFADVYTNIAGSNQRLYDIGPSGGTCLGVDVGGWVFYSAILNRYYALPPNKHISSGWFLYVNAGYDALYTFARPTGVMATATGVDSNRMTYWTPRRYYLETNTIPQLPLWQATTWGYWTPSGDGYAWDFDTPNVYDQGESALWRAAYPRSALLALTPSASSYWANYQHPYADPIEDLYFGGWTNAAIPTLGGNANYVGYTNAWAQFVAGTNNTFWTTNALNSLAGWLAKQRVRIVNYDSSPHGYKGISFTNTFEYWISRNSDTVAYQSTNLAQFVSDMNAAYAGLLTDNAWYDNDGSDWGVVSDFGYVAGGDPADNETFGWGFSIKPVLSAGNCYWIITYRSKGGDIRAELGWGQNTNGFEKIVAHGFLRDLGDGTTNCTFYVPESETAGVDLNTSFQHRLCALAFDIDGYDAGPVWVSDGVPAYTNVPASGDLPTFTPLTTDGTNVITAGWPKYKGWAASGPYVTFEPRWSALTNFPAL